MMVWNAFIKHLSINKDNETYFSGILLGETIITQWVRIYVDMCLWRVGATATFGVHIIAPSAATTASTAVHVTSATASIVLVLVLS